ncbi:MAG TPA: sigma-70 family RNA polymerase sigma factor [Polyangiaceae bacterium]|nr:sigma-70 family RNA polymerase sigma factor [Polyangiaceae bacterium]
MSAVPFLANAPLSNDSPSFALVPPPAAPASEAAAAEAASKGANAPDPVSRESVEAYLPLVHQTVRRFLRKLPPNVSRDDLVSAGAFGLMDALRKNGGGEGAAFEWYARLRIRGAIVDALRQQDWLSRRARWAVASGEGAGATAVVSFEDMAAGEQATALVDERADDPAERAEANDTRARLERAVAALPDRERLIVSMHYFEGKLFKDIGALLGVSEPRISQLHARAMGKLRAELQQG